MNTEIDARPSTALRPPARRFRLWLEFTALFLAVPVWMAALEQAARLWTVMAVMLVVGIGLYAVTPGAGWRRLMTGGIGRHWRLILIFAVVTGAATGGLVFWLLPDRFLQLPTQAPGLWLRIMLLYPLLSALPQELVFRALFFERYGGLFGNGPVVLVVNAGVFALAHLFYANGVAVGLTFLGGLVFAWAYRRLNSFPLAVVLHMLGGQIVFTLGLGWYFYHGAVGGL